MATLSDEKLAKIKADPVYEQILSSVQNEVSGITAERVALNFWLMLQNTLSWDTTCLNCSNLLDRLYEADMRREQAELALDELTTGPIRGDLDGCYD